VLGLCPGVLFNSSHLFIRSEDQPFVNHFGPLLFERSPGFAELPDAHW
jgi:hypothetical protein